MAGGVVLTLFFEMSKNVAVFSHVTIIKYYYYYYNYNSCVRGMCEIVVLRNLKWLWKKSEIAKFRSFAKIARWASEEWLLPPSQWTKKVVTSSSDSLACALIDLGAFGSTGVHLPREKPILPYFSSLSMVAILVCDSHRQAGSMNSPLLDVPIFISKLTLEIMYSRRYYTQIRQHFPHFESDSLCWWRRWDDVCHRSWSRPPPRPTPAWSRSSSRRSPPSRRWLGWGPWWGFQSQRGGCRESWQLEAKRWRSRRPT